MVSSYFGSLSLLVSYVVNAHFFGIKSHLSLAYNNLWALNAVDSFIDLYTPTSNIERASPACFI